jgi:hypothetical protein
MFGLVDKFRSSSLNNQQINLFIKNYNRVISTNYNVNNITNKKILTIIACHSNTLIKCNAVINNIPYLLFPNNDIVIVNSSNEKYSDKLKNYIATCYRTNSETNSNIQTNEIIKYIEIPNDKYIDIGKYIHVLNSIRSDDSFCKDYEFVVLINDSVIIRKSISHFYNMIIKMDKELYAYNDSSEIKYHYQSYLYAIKYNVIHKLIDYFNIHKNSIRGYKDVISKIELELNNIYATSNDCFLKIANLPSNINKNIYFHNDILYNLLFNNGILPFIKIRALDKKITNANNSNHVNIRLNI